MEHGTNTLTVEFAASEGNGPCLYCGCEVAADEIAGHGDGCPFTTGVWPLEEGEGSFECSGCGEVHTAGCARCKEPLEGAYRLVDATTGLLVGQPEMPSETLAVCMACATAQSEALAARFAELDR